LYNPALLNSYLGQGLQYQAPLYNPALANASSALGYSSLLGSPAYGGYGAGGYGAGGYGAGGYATQWMMNPYEGYLRGAADITTADAKYQLTIQQAKLQRQEAIRSTYQTRRAAIEESEYERGHVPDLEKIRGDQVRRELDRARVSPPLTEIWSGKALNVLLRHLVQRHYKDARGPDVPLSEDTLKSINLTVGDTRGNAGLLKDNGALQWPQPLQGKTFKDAREDFDRRLKDATNAVSRGNNPEPRLVSELVAGLRKLSDVLDASVGGLSPDQYIEARRYLRLLGDTVAVLRDPRVANYFNGKWVATERDVASLVEYMAKEGVQFAPATPNDAAAYLTLYNALVAFDAGMPRAASTNGRDNGSAGK
jgi:hypothetical protein